MIIEMDTDVLNAIAKDIRAVAEKHDCSIMELSQACSALICQKYFEERVEKMGLVRDRTPLKTN